MDDYLEYVSAEGTELKTLIKTYLSVGDQARVLQSMAFAQEKHSNDLRKDGHVFYQHPFTVAYYLAEYRLDADTLIAAILHDVAEDVEKVTIEDIEQLFGKEVGKLVDAVTKIELNSAEKTPHTKKAQSLATFHKLFAAMVQDVRVILIKLFDRLHNMRTIKSMGQASQDRSARESLDVYAPIAHRLGLWQIKSELETLSLEVVDSVAYCTLHQQLCLDKEQKKTRTEINVELIACLQRTLHNANIDIIDIGPSERNPYPIYKRAKQKNHDRFVIDPSPRLVIVVKDVIACYAALGVIHQLWKPHLSQLDDYIALPRVNMYRALHSNVITDDGQIVKIRLRTPAMKRISEVGVLAKWRYQQDEVLDNNVAEENLDKLVDELFESIQGHVQGDAENVYHGVLDDVLSEQIIVYSPLGEAFLMPLGSTPLDFAYRIHTDVGHGAYQAYVNYTHVALNSTLNDGDRVEIDVRPANPKRRWLNADLGYLHTHSAMQRVRRHFRSIDPKTLLKDGCRLLQDELRMAGLEDYSAEKIANIFGYETAEELQLNIGLGLLLTSEISAKLIAFAWADNDVREIGRTVQDEDGRSYIIYNADQLGDISLCRNCRPRPGDTICGYIRDTTDITVHRDSCHDLPRVGEDVIFVALDWGQMRDAKSQDVVVWVDIYDRPQMILDIAQVLAPDRVNINAMSTEDLPRGMRLIFTFGILNPRQLVRIMHKIRSLLNVRSIRCFPIVPPAACQKAEVI